MAIAQLEQLKSKYSLEEDPFSPRLDAFYEGGQRAHTIEVLRHMAIFGDMVLSLIGEQGAGKTHLISQFSLMHANDISIMTIAAEERRSDSIRRFSSLSGMELPEDYPDQDLLELLVDRLTEQYQRTGKRTLLIIDDAHLLSREELLIYLNVMSCIEPECGASLLLVGQSTLGDSLKSFQHPDRSDWLHQITLRPLTLSEVSEYLLARFKAAGFEGEMVLSPPLLEYLTSHSNGVPAEIHTVFCRKMLNADIEGDETGSEEQPRTKSSVDQYALVGIAFALIISFVFLAYQYNFFAEPSAPDMSAPDKLEVQEVIPSPGLEVAREERLKAINSAIQDSQVNTDEALPVSSPSSTESPSPSTFVVSPSESEEVGQKIDSAESEGLSKRRSVEQQAQADSANQIEPEVNRKAGLGSAEPAEKEVAERKPAVPFDPLARSSEWLFEQPKTDYSAQVLGSYSEETAKRYASKLVGKTKHPVYYLESRYKGQPWFIALYGQFSTEAEAREAIRNAESVIRSQNPWVRSFEGIQSSLE